ncbi:MAG: molybdenum cofactor guanylyltransferase [Sedimentisphaerales bacterium]
MSSSKMIRLDGMLMIGSAGANVGKTELACALIRKFSKSTDIIGIKVTTIKAKDGQCPRGGQGCGVCSSLEGNFYITREINTTSGKDTARLLAAGASRVFWLRVLKTHLKEGITALLDIIGPDAVSICESNSLRQVVEPGLFIMVKGRNLKVWKSSARQVKEYADRIVICDGNNFDFDIDRIKLAGGKWLMQEEATAIIMAGGDSLRMGNDKSLLPIKGQGPRGAGTLPMIKHICEQLHGTFSQILISANEAEKFAFLGFEVIPDRIPGQGPLMGIASTLQASANELNFVVACDIPHIDLACVRRMLAKAKAVDLVIPTTGDGKYEPLFAVYRKSALAAINEVLSSGGRKISDVFSRCRVKYIDLGDAEWLINLNTIAEYEEFCKKYNAKV